MPWSSPVCPVCAGAFGQALGSLVAAEDEKKRERVWISVPGRLGSSQKLGQKFKHCKSQKFPPRKVAFGRTKIPDKN